MPARAIAYTHTLSLALALLLARRDVVSEHRLSLVVLTNSAALLARHLRGTALPRGAPSDAARLHQSVAPAGAAPHSHTRMSFDAWAGPPMRSARGTQEPP